MRDRDAQPGNLSRWRRLDHAQRFSVVALVSVAACAILFSALLQKTVHRIVRENDERQTASFMRHVVSTEFEDALFTDNEPIRDVDLGRRLLKALALDEVFRIKLYGRDGTILWSDEKELLGIRFSDNGHLNDALRGETNSVIETPDRDEHVFEKGMFDRIMETYIPIHRGSVVIGVVEIYRYPEKLFLATKVATWVLWASSLGGGALLYLAMVGVVRRINNTQRKLEKDLRRSADELTAEKSKLERILNAMGAGLVQVNGDGRIQWANERAESWFGNGEGLVGASTLSRFCKEGGSCDHCPFASERPAKFPVVCESKVHGTGGRERVYQLITTPEPPIDRAGIPVNFLQLLLDVTDAKTVEAQLRHADKMSLTGQLAAGIAHQINNPVGILLTTITHRLAKFDAVGNGDLVSDFQMMERQCRRIDQSVRSLLSFSRLPAGVCVPLDLRSVIAEAIELTEPRMKRNGVRVETSFEERPHVAPGDPNDSLQVVLNLVNNAIDAMPDGGDLKLALDILQTAKDPSVLLTVTDTGEGLPAGDPEQVFEPFFTTKEIGHGTGLGLAVSKRIVDGLGGRIEATNGQGGGAVLQVRFPMGHS